MVHKKKRLDFEFYYVMNSWLTIYVFGTLSFYSLEIIVIILKVSYKKKTKQNI